MRATNMCEKLQSTQEAPLRMTSNQPLIAVIAGLGILFVLSSLVQSSRKTKWAKLPPAIPGLPIIGNSLSVPATQQGPWAKEQAEKYGEM